MSQYLAARLAQLPLVIFVISLIVFLLVHLVPGDPVTIMLGPMSTPELQEALTRYYGLDQPLPQQYVNWLAHVATGDLGTSIRTSEPVTKMIADRLPATAVLAVGAMVLSLLISLPAGLLAAVNRNRLIDHVVMAGSLVGFSIPNFVLAIVMVLTLGVQLRLLPIAVGSSALADPGRAVASYVMPVVALALYYMAVLARQFRSSVLDVLGRDYIRTARAKGLAETVLLRRHAIKNAVIPVITLVAINFAYLLGGAIVVEQIFIIPGIGSLLLQAAIQRDFPVLQGVTLVVAVFFIVSNLVADLLYVSMDPRIRYA
jgi:peptide/nickel transport system permease protein